MSTPFYVSPEQWYQDKAEYARKGIARGRPIVALEYETGIVMMAENRSATLRKISEIYDRIAFGGVGKLDEYETLRKSGVRYADMRGYSFSREDVAGKSLANEYSNVLGSVFTREMKPLEVAILVEAREWRAEFEWWAHVRLARRAGVSAEVIAAIESQTAFARAASGSVSSPVLAGP